MDIKIKNYLGVALIFGVLVFSVAAWNFAHSVEPDSFRSFTVSASGKSIAIPDIAQFTFSVITEGGLDLDNLQKENAKKVNDAIDFVKDNDVNKKDIKTTSFNVFPRRQVINCFRAPCPAPEIIGYRITQSVSVKVRDFEKAGALISGVIERGANSVSQLNFIVDDQTEVENEARKEAFDKARDKAKQIAKAGGFKLGRLLNVTEAGGFQPQSLRFFAEGVAVSDGAIPQIEPGSQEITVNISLRYEIK